MRHRSNRFEGAAVAQMAPSNTDHCPHAESGIEHSRYRTPDIRGRGKSVLLIPIRMVFTKKVHRHDALSVAFNALVLS
jgi:hypothetical protein